MAELKLTTKRGFVIMNGMKNGRGKFIVFEGTDGSGKSTQCKLLYKYLAAKGVAVYQTSEPTDSPFGAQLRACLSGRIETDEHTIAALFAADRLDHIFNGVNGILKKLESGVSVLCDRYYFSSFAYNGGFVSPEWVYALNEKARETLRADLTLFIDLPPETGMERVKRRGAADRYETIEKQRRIRQNYLDLFEKFGAGENIKIIESLDKKEDTHRAIIAVTDELYGF